MYRRTPFGGLFLLAQVLNIGLGNIPPVTLTILLLCTILHYNIFNWHLPINDMSLLPVAVLYYKELHRLITSAFLHGSDMHLYFNMTSLLMKGRYLEGRMGSLRFGLVCASFTVLSNGLEVLVSFILDRFFDYPGPMYTQSIGFSAVLFALKVIIHANTEGSSSFMGIIVPTKYVYWAELLLISLIYPQASFLGHLCGIFSGLLYVKGYLPPIIESIINFLSFFNNNNARNRPVASPFRSFSNTPSYTYHVGPTNSNGPTPYANESAGERRTRLLHARVRYY